LSQASQSSIEHVLVESCDDLIAKENDELKQKVEKLQDDLYALKEKSKVQPSQDNREDMVKKLEKGSTASSTTYNDPQEQDSRKEQGWANQISISPNQAQDTRVTLQEA
jgi:hypothetical protein